MLKEQLFKISSESEFERTALEIFQFQYERNLVYKKYCDLLNIEKENIQRIEEIPFLPIQFFKTYRILSSSKKPEKIFTSSGTTGIQTSKHHIADLSLYEKSFTQGFEEIYGPVKEYVVLALLPSYLEREGSSLIYMVNDFIEKSNFRESGFYLNNLSELAKTLKKLDSEEKKIILFGVSFALLDLVEKFRFNLKNTIIVETGGMKGRRKELIRKELHEILQNGFGVEKIHSEYGMTELLSQAYSTGEGIFTCSDTLKVLIRDPEDPFKILPNGKTGGINIIDLANLYSCSFLATQDLGKKMGENKFEILGRFDNSDLRGCNLLLL
ncbi:MAG TPA: acyl transferase [Flavobacteriaceae bacterium]|nr:acyl transferase [Flavobacteriaceae bacterium]